MATLEFDSLVGAGRVHIHICEEFAPQTYESRTADTTTSVRLIIRETTKAPLSQEDAKEAVNLSVPLSFGDINSLARDRISLTQVTDYAWRAVVTWRQFGDCQPGEEKYTASTLGSSVQTMFSLATIATYESGNATPITEARNFQLVNVTEDGPQGTEVETPGLEFQIEHCFPKGTITPEWIEAISYYSKRVNNTVWRGYQKGEVFFRGIEFTHEPNNLIDKVTYFFVAEQNKNPLTLPNGFDVVKEGHHYVWFSYTTAQDGDVEVKKPTHAHVEQMYEELSFALLGIPVTL